ncbi:MAG: PPC domain-containing protein [Verrucomicrobiota bacterium]
MTRFIPVRNARLRLDGIRLRSLVGVAAVVLAASSAFAGTPDLSTTIPRGGQVGTELKVTFQGNRLEGTEEVLFHYPGITAKDIKVLDSRKVEVTLVIAPDARLGEHHVRLRTRRGTSYARNFWVSQFPNVDEVEPNDDFDEPQKVPLNVTIEAEAKPKETDYYQVTAKKGDRISVEIEGLRINNIRQNIAIDPFVAILDSERFELGRADGSSLHKQESILSVVVPEDGEYTIEVRDSAFQGRGRYRAHIGTFPRPSVVYPLGGPEGEEVEFAVLDPSGELGKMKLSLSGDEVKDHGLFYSENGIQVPSPNPVRVSQFGNTFEMEPNNSSGEVKNQEPVSLPTAFNGILESEGDTDYFAFSAKKGQSYRFQVYARSLGSPVDPVLTVFDEKIKSLGGSDDADGSKDGRVDFKAPADGTYFVRVHDHLKGGGPDYAYRVETETREKTVLVTMPEMLRRDLQYRKQFDVPQGGYYAMTVNTRRQGVSGDLQFVLPSLPKGVELVGGRIPKSQSTYSILLRAKPDAPIGGGMHSLQVRALETDPPISGTFVQNLDFVRGPQNGVEYYTRPVEQLPITVVEPLPFSVTIEQPQVPIVRNGTMLLKVKAHRKDGYDKDIIVRLGWKPPGITSPASMTFKGGATELTYELNANGNAELGTWPITLLVESNDGKGVRFTATPFINLAVEEPFATLKLPLTTVKQGDEAQFLASLETLREFPGEAEIQLFGIPAHSTTPVMKQKSGATELAIPVTTTEKTPVGQHKNLFCTFTVTMNGEPIVQRVGMGGILRVDPKPKAPAAAPAKPKTEVAAAAPKPKPEKPLSRLEQLRLEAKQAGGGE